MSVSSRAFADGRRPRVLLVTRNMPPLLGGMERLNLQMALQLSRYADVRVVGPRWSAPFLTQVSHLPVPHRPLPLFLAAALFKTVAASRLWKPDWVLAGSGLSAPMARFAARAAGARMAVYVHGLDVGVQHPVYRAVWGPAIGAADRVIANSRATAALARALGVPEKRLIIIPPGVAIRPPPSRQQLAAFRQLHAPGAGPLLVIVGRLTQRKGVRQWVEASLPALAQRFPELVVLLAGQEANDAILGRTQSVAEVRDAARRAGVERHLRFMGAITSDATLDLLFAAADVHVFPVRDLVGDPEGFGMVAVEAAAQGTPTVAFATGGVSDAVEQGASGLLAAPGDYRALTEAIELAIAAREGFRRTARHFAMQFEWSTFGERLAHALGMDLP